MQHVDVAEVVNSGFACCDCHATRGWVRVGKPLMRKYSHIQHLQCAHCGVRIVAKLGRAGVGDAARLRTRIEYETLCALQSRFPQDARFGTLEPLGFLEGAGSGIVITRFVPGDDLMHYLRTQDVDGVKVACHAAGAWLRKLHDRTAHGGRMLALGVADKLGYLRDTYIGALRSDQQAHVAYALLSNTAARVGNLTVHAARLHGDFKPENMLCDGVRYVGLDIHWGSTAAAVYDLAPFLDHLWLGARGIIGSRLRCSHALAEAAFLSGYGDAGERCALRWAQLYFALAYLGGYCKRGMLAAGYLTWKVRPLVRELSAQLQSALPTD